MRTALLTALLGLALAVPSAPPAAPVGLLPEVSPASGLLPTTAGSGDGDWAATRERPATQLERRASRRLAGEVIVLDPGHQLGNYRFPRKTSRLVDAGGFKKACNSTGTATRRGFPEATFTWRVARALRAQLVARGATVHVTRHTNSLDDWGPCIDVRGRKGNRVDADAVVSIHGDGATSRARGFFVIRPGRREGWTDDIARSSRTLSRMIRRGLVRAGGDVANTYGGDGLDRRTDLGTLNWSNRPIVMVELGNMRNGRDARRMTSPQYRRTVYAKGLRLGITRFVLRQGR